MLQQSATVHKKTDEQGTRNKELMLNEQCSIFNVENIEQKKEDVTRETQTRTKTNSTYKLVFPCNGFPTSASLFFTGMDCTAEKGTSPSLPSGSSEI